MPNCLCNGRDKRSSDYVIDEPPQPSKKTRAANRSDFNLEYSLEERRRQRRCFLTLDAVSNCSVVIKPVTNGDIVFSVHETQTADQRVLLNVPGRDDGFETRHVERQD